MRRRTPSFLTKIEARMEAACHTRADLVTTVSDTMTELMVRDFNSPALTVFNGYPESWDNPTQNPQPSPVSERKHICYLGTLIHGLRTPALLFQAASLLGGGAGRLRFDFWCNDPALVLNEADRFGVRHLVACHPPVSLAESLRLQSTADVNLVLNGIDDSANHMITGKVFELIAARRPVIAVTGVRSELRRILEKCGCNGVVWDEATARIAIERALSNSLNMVGDIDRSFSRESAVRTLLNAIEARTQSLSLA